MMVLQLEDASQGRRIDECEPIALSARDVTTLVIQRPTEALVIFIAIAIKRS